MRKVVVAGLFGDAESSAMIAALAAEADVIAVACDLVGGVALTALHDLALAAGAVRCHALDLRDSFAREVLLPAVRSGASADWPAGISRLARPFIAAKLDEIAALEDAEAVLPSELTLPLRRLPDTAVQPIQVDVRIDGGVPVAINGVEMTLTELLDSLETITGLPAFAALKPYLTRGVPADHAHHV